MGSHAFVYVTLTGIGHCVLQARLLMHTGDAVNRQAHVPDTLRHACISRALQSSTKGMTSFYVCDIFMRHNHVARTRDMLQAALHAVNTYLTL